MTKSVGNTNTKTFSWKRKAPFSSGLSHASKVDDTASSVVPKDFDLAQEKEYLEKCEEVN